MIDKASALVNDDVARFKRGLSMSTSTETVKERAEIADSDKWNVAALYPSVEVWKKEMQEVCRPDQKPHWPEISAYQGKLGEGASVLKEFLEVTFELDRKMSKLYTYAHMRHDEDLAEDSHKVIYSMITALYHDLGQETSWVEPELLALSDETIQAYLKDPALELYRFHIERVVRQKPHTLPKEQEKLLALAGQALGTPSKSFGAFNNADLKFPPVRNQKGEELEMSHAKYGLYMRDEDRTLRKSAFDSMYETFHSFENTLCEMLNGKVQTAVFSTRARNYPTSLDAALYGNNIDTKVYTNLVETVREHLPVLHHYMKVRKGALKLDELHMYDLAVPIVPSIDLRYTYDEAEALVIDSVAPLGKEYQSILHKGLKGERWVDRYENLRKRSGAYSTGCFDSMPYILMNYQGTFSDLTTLAHEAGHSMHSYYSHKNQPYPYSHYPIFLAEVASTFNEELMFHLLMEKNPPKEVKAYLINQKIEDIRNTFFRQTMFAEFELLLHKLAEKDTPLTPTLLKESYLQLNRDYFGTSVVVDELIDIEWARIPHFYYNFYVYQYATGISAAHALFENVLKKGEDARDRYLAFLSSGSSQYPLDLLELAGVNMREKEPIEATINQFARLVSELETLI